MMSKQKNKTKQNKKRKKKKKNRIIPVVHLYLKNLTGRPEFTTNVQFIGLS